MKYLIQKYSPLSLSIIVLLIFLPDLSSAQNSGTFITSNQTEAELVPRFPTGDAEFHITTNENSVNLLLTNSAIFLQFTDDYLEKISEDIHGKNEPEESAHFAAVLRAALSSGVRTLLDRAITVPLDEIEEIYYDNGRLFIINRDGKDMFEGAEIEDIEIMEDFSRRNARRFVAEAERRMI